MKTVIRKSKTDTSNTKSDKVKFAGAQQWSAKQKTETKARLEARITQSTHSRIKLAAEIQGRTVTDFVVHAALEAATKAIEENFVVQLSVEGQQAFAESLLNPPEPNDALRRAFERHSALVGKKD